MSGMEKDQGGRRNREYYMWIDVEPNLLYSIDHLTQLGPGEGGVDICGTSRSVIAVPIGGERSSSEIIGLAGSPYLVAQGG